MPARVLIKNTGANKDLAAWADVQEMIVGDAGTEVTYTCSAQGRRMTTRHVTQSAESSFTGWVTPVGSSPTVEFRDVDAAICWMIAGQRTPRDHFDDEVDFRAVTGGQEAHFRLSEMLASGTFCPSEFATCALLLSHGACDWGHHSADSLQDRYDSWDAAIEEHRAAWPDVAEDEFVAAQLIFRRMAKVLDEQFAREKDKCESDAFWRAVGVEDIEDAA